MMGHGSKDRAGLRPAGVMQPPETGERAGRRPAGVMNHAPTQAGASEAAG